MADQVTGVRITLGTGSPPTTYDVAIPALGYGEQGLPLSALFDRTAFDPAHLFGNIRLKNVIGNYGLPLWSSEFTNALNATGIATTSGDFFNVSFAANQDGSYTIGFATALGGVPNQTITFNPIDLTEDTHDIAMAVRNIGAFLRRAGFHDLTTPAPSGVFAGKTGIQAVALQTFRY